MLPARYRSFKLPSTTEMKQKLKEADPDIRLEEKFFPYVTEHGGEKVLPVFLGVFFIIAAHNFTKHMDKRSRKKAIASLKFNKFVDAVVEDKEAAKITKDFIKEVLEMARR